MSTHESDHRLDLQQRVEELQRELAAAHDGQARLEQENTDLRASLTRALEQQALTSEILRVLASSTTALQPVLDAVARNAARVCDADDAIIHRIEGDVLQAVAHYGPVPLFPPMGSAEGLPIRGSVTGRAVLERRVIHIHDAGALSELDFPVARRNQPLTGQRTTLAAPLLREEVPVGTILIRRLEVRPFTEEQIEMLMIFADQAAIAIETTRLFRELDTRNHELTEALTRQTATAHVLKVINTSPTDVQPVFDAIVEEALRLCDGVVSAVYRRDGDRIHLVAHRNISAAGLEEFRRAYPIPVSADSLVARSVVERMVVNVGDAQDDPGVPPLARRIATAAGYRSLLLVPIVREGRAVGAIGVARREAGRFPDEQIWLLRTFADQAVLAMENLRLFEELEARNRELADALEHRTATNDVLSVMSRSTFDLEPLLETIIENGTRLCRAETGFVYRFDGEAFRLVAGHGVSPEFRDVLLRNPPRPGRSSIVGRTALERRTVHVHDVLADAEYGVPDLQRTGSYRTVLGVPMLKDDALIGVITWARARVEPFRDKEIELVRSFADQAAIALEHIRLFQELEARRAQLTRSVDELRALVEVGQAVGSTLDLQTVLMTIVARAVELSGSDGGIIYEFDEGTATFHVKATHRINEEHLKAVQAEPIRLGDGAIGAAGATRTTVQVADMLDDREPVAAQARDILVRLGYRSLLAIPLVRNDRLLGGLVVWRRTLGRFATEVVSLLETFAAQSVIAIQNARLFEEVREKGRELEVLSGNLERLYRLSTAMQEPLSLREHLHRVLENARDVVGIDRFYAWVVGPDGNYIVNLVGAGMSQADLEQFEGHVIPLSGAGALYRAYRERRSLAFTEDHPLPPELAFDPKYLIPPLRTKRFVVVPMVARGTTVGLLVGDNKPSGRPILPHTVDLLQTFASHAAVAIANARLFQAIEEKGRQLEAASRHKSEFLANMSHELRTPLNAIIGFSDLLLERMFGELNEKQAEYLQDIVASGRHLLSLINDILDLSKIEAGRMELDLCDFDLPKAIDDAVTLVRERASRRGIALQQTVDPQLGQIRADERKVKQVLLNLLSNALKFTPEGGRVEVRAIPLDDGMVEIAVTDTGIGIAPENQHVVFEEFRQVGAADRKVEGTGLGLALCRKFVELHDGHIWLKSQLGTGSTFTFAIPVRRGECSMDPGS